MHRAVNVLYLLRAAYNSRFSQMPIAYEQPFIPQQKRVTNKHKSIRSSKQSKAVCLNNSHLSTPRAQKLCEFELGIFQVFVSQHLLILVLICDCSAWCFCFCLLLLVKGRQPWFFIKTAVRVVCFESLFLPLQAGCCSLCPSQCLPFVHQSPRSQICSRPRRGTWSITAVSQGGPSEILFSYLSKYILDLI